MLTGEVELGQRPELEDVAALSGEAVLVFVSDERQTAIVSGGAYIRLDWLRWINEVLGDSADNATFTIRRTQLDESGTLLGPAEILEPSGSEERVVVNVDPETNEFHVTITRVISAQGAEDPDRAIFDLEACLLMADGTTECYSSNITVFAIEITPPLGMIITTIFSSMYSILLHSFFFFFYLVLECAVTSEGGNGVTQISCESNNPLESPQLCTLEPIFLDALECKLIVVYSLYNVTCVCTKFRVHAIVLLKMLP